MLTIHDLETHLIVTETRNRLIAWILLKLVAYWWLIPHVSCFALKFAAVSQYDAQHQYVPYFLSYLILFIQTYSNSSTNTTSISRNNKLGTLIIGKVYFQFEISLKKRRTGVFSYTNNNTRKWNPYFRIINYCGKSNR